jgi:hypothetical protein
LAVDFTVLDLTGALGLAAGLAVLGTAFAGASAAVFTGFFATGFLLATAVTGATELALSALIPLFLVTMVGLLDC